MASIGLTQLKYLDDDNTYRNKVSKWYDELLQNVEGVKTIPINWSIAKSSRHLYQILVDKNKRDDIITKLYENEIYPGVHYVDNTLYRMYGYANGSCPNAHRYSDELITLPIHLGIEEDDCVRIVEILKEIL